MASGLILGFSAGMSPGPLMTVVVSQTLKFGSKEGIKVGLTPIFTDGPIILLAFFVLSKFAHVNALLGIISILGALFLLFLAYENLTAKNIVVSETEVKPHSFKKGIIANALNPYPYVFYFTVGGAIILKALQYGVVSALLFILGVTAAVVGAKILIAFLTSISRTFLNNKAYQYCLKILGLVLLVFAFIFLRDGLKFLHFIK